MSRLSCLYCRINRETDRVSLTSCTQSHKTLSNFIRNWAQTRNILLVGTEVTARDRHLSLSLPFWSLELLLTLRTSKNLIVVPHFPWTCFPAMSSLLSYISPSFAHQQTPSHRIDTQTTEREKEVGVGYFRSRQSLYIPPQYSLSFALKSLSSTLSLFASVRVSRDFWLAVDCVPSFVSQLFFVFFSVGPLMTMMKRTSSWGLENTTFECVSRSLSSGVCI